MTRPDPPVRMSRERLTELISQNASDLAAALESGQKAWVDTLHWRAASLRELERRMDRQRPAELSGRVPA